MTREVTKGIVAKCTAHAMRVAAIRLARERAAEQADPAQTYGCVDWFRYDVAPRPPQDAHTEADTEERPIIWVHHHGSDGTALGR